MASLNISFFLMKTLLVLSNLKTNENDRIWLECKLKEVMNELISLRMQVPASVMVCAAVTTTARMIVSKILKACLQWTFYRVLNIIISQLKSHLVGIIENYYLHYRGQSSMTS